MIETTTTPRIREGFNQAHQERAEIVRTAWLWLTRGAK